MRNENTRLTLGSLFDGIGGFPLAGMQAGIRPVWASEIEPFPIRVVEKRLPHVRHYGDVHHLNGGALEPVDIITFGSPCQDLSIAGKRSGLDGARSGLFHEAVRVINEMREKTNGRYPRWAVWENVPGALSSLHGRDFREVLEKLIHIKDSEADVPMPPKDQWLPAGEILGDSYSLAWRVLDAAQGWGVAQRRKRVFVVLDLDGQCAGKVLFESEGMSGYSPPRTETRQRTAGSASQSTATTGAGMSEASGFCTEHSANSRGIGFETERSPTLRAGVVPGIAIKAYGISADQSNAMLSDNPHAGIYEADTSRTLDCNCGNPSCNQGGMQETAEKWKDTAAETFYGQSDGLSFFGMSEADFIRTTQNAQEWMDGLLEVWTDGQKETEEIVSEWTEAFKKLTASTRNELAQMQETAEQAGYSGVSEQLMADIALLNGLDQEIERLLKRKQNGYFSDTDKIRLQELIDTREAIEVKYNLSPADVDGFDTIRRKLEAEIARAQARGLDDASVMVYENAVIAAAEGMAAVNAKIDEQYDKEYELIKLIEDASERQSALDELNARYNQNRYDAAVEYAQTLSSVVMPVWEQENIQQAATDVDLLTQKLREYSTANETERPAILEDINAITAAMDEGSITEYIGLLTQIQSLLDSGMSETEIQAMFPEIDFSAALEQIAAIQSFLNQPNVELPALSTMFGEALPEEALKIATDLDMTGAQARWDEFAANPGAITTEAIISGFQDAENAEAIQPTIEAFISKYTEIPEGADTAELTPEGVVAYVGAYAEATSGVDVSSLTPDHITAMIAAYKELDTGADISTLKPEEVTAYVFQYLEANDVDTSSLKPEAVTAYVMAYEEATGGALTSSLAPGNITAMVSRYLQAEDVDLSALSTAQTEAIVTAFAEATNCDKSALLQDFTAYITKYDDSAAERPSFSLSVGISGYDLIAYRQFVANHPVEVQGIVRLGEVYQNPTDVLGDAGASFWQNGQEIPVSAVPTEMLTADKVAVLAEDGTLHVLISPEITGAEEAIAELRTEVEEVDQLGTTVLGNWAGIMPTTTFDLIDSAIERIKTFNEQKGTFWQLWGLGEDGALKTLDASMKSDFNPERVAELSTYAQRQRSQQKRFRAVSSWHIIK